MAGKNTKGSKAMSKEFFEALEIFEHERGIPADYMIEKITAAIVVAVKNSSGNENVVVNIIPETATFDVFLNKVVVEELDDPNKQILLDAARLINRNAVIGDTVGIKLDTREFGRIAAMTAKQVIRQGIREVERNQVSDAMRSREQELVTAVVERVDPESGVATLTMGKITVPLLKNEQIEGEVFTPGQNIKVFVVSSKDSTGKSTRTTVSRTHPGLVKRLFETEVPEIFDGTVEIKSVSREAGSRTKVAVFSHDESVDAVGACIGMRHSRINEIVSELGGNEKIDVIKWSEDPVEFISNALSPASVVSVELDPENGRSCHVKVPENQLSLAIGHKGQNARLAARLTGYKIDIHPESGYYGEDQ